MFPDLSTATPAGWPRLAERAGRLFGGGPPATVVMFCPLASCTARKSKHTEKQIILVMVATNRPFDSSNEHRRNGPRPNAAVLTFSICTLSAWPESAGDSFVEILSSPSEIALGVCATLSSTLSIHAA